MCAPLAGVDRKNPHCAARAPGPRAHLHDQRVGDGFVLALARPQITASKRSFSALFVPFRTTQLRARTVGSGEGEGRVSVIPSRRPPRGCGCSRGSVWEYNMRFRSVCARGAIRSAAHSTARWVPPTRMRVDVDARRGRRSMRRTWRVNRTVTEPTGSTGVPASPEHYIFSAPQTRSGSGPVFGARRVCDREDGGRVVAALLTPGSVCCSAVGSINPVAQPQPCSTTRT